MSPDDLAGAEISRRMLAKTSRQPEVESSQHVAAESNGRISADDAAELEAGLDADAATERERLWQLALASKVRELRLLDEAREVLRAEKRSEAHDATDRMVDGGTFIYEAPDHVPAVWGKGDEVLWSMGEPLLITGPTGVGKALRDDQPILTPTGWVPIGKLRAGDEVIGSSGQPTLVTGVYPQGVRELFEVVTSDGITIVADKDHLWLTQTTTDRMNGHHHWIPETTAGITETLTVQMGGRDRVNHYLPMLTAPVQGPTVPCPLDPWLLGVLIGDGSLTGSSVNLSNPDTILLDRVRMLLPGEATLRPRVTDGKEWRIRTPRGSTNPVLNALRDLGVHGCLSYEKTIPESLLYASAAQRHALLNGLLDTDGSVYGSNTVEYSTTSPFLAEQVPWLVQSLGGTVHVSTRPAPTYVYKGERRTGRFAWRIRMSLPPEILPFAYSAKVDRYTPRTKYPPRRQIVSITQVDNDFATCISVAASDKLYVTAGCVLTHNTTLGGQVIAGRMGLVSKILGYPVMPGKRVLYLAMDRPNQISRALARLLRQFPRDVLAEKIKFWRGPPPMDLAMNPETLLDLAQRADADTVVLDSLKDAAVNLSDETVGQGISRAMQMCIAADIEVIGYHHQKKHGNGGINKPNSLADVYGSNWITAGVGSVLLIWGDAGDPIVELSHLKQPAGEVGPLSLVHDVAAGTMSILESEDVLDLLLGTTRTAAEVATALYGATNPSRAQVEKARRKLGKLVAAGLAVQLGDPSSGGTSGGRKGGGEGARYGAATRVGSVHGRSTVSEFPQVDRVTQENDHPRSTVSVHGRSTSVHENDITAGRSVHASVHARTGPDRSTPAASPLGGEAGDQREDLEPVRSVTRLDASGDQWLHCHLTVAPQTVTRLATDLDATDVAVEAALTRLAAGGHAQRHPGLPGAPAEWSLPAKTEQENNK